LLYLAKNEAPEEEEAVLDKPRLKDMT